MERFEKPLVRYAAYLLGERDRARDVVQEVFLELCRRGPEIPVEALRPWLFTVCRHRAVDHWRKEQHMMPVSDEQLVATAAPEPSPPQAAERGALYQRVLAAVATLPANQQEVLRLRFLGELSYREISQVTGLSETNVGYLIHTAIGSLRRHLGNELVEGAGNEDR